MCIRDRKKTVRKQWLEDLVVNQTRQLVKDDAAMESIIAKVMERQNKENTNIPLYKKHLRVAESGIQNMLNAIQAGILKMCIRDRRCTVRGRGEAVVIGCDPNTSLYFTNVHLPAVKYHIPKGHTGLDTEVFDEAD